MALSLKVTNKSCVLRLVAGTTAAPTALTRYGYELGRKLFPRSDLFPSCCGSHSFLLILSSGGTQVRPGGPSQPVGTDLAQGRRSLPFEEGFPLETGQSFL